MGRVKKFLHSKRSGGGASASSPRRNDNRSNNNDDDGHETTKTPLVSGTPKSSTAGFAVGNQSNAQEIPGVPSNASITSITSTTRSTTSIRSSSGGSASASASASIQSTRSTSSSRSVRSTSAGAGAGANAASVAVDVQPQGHQHQTLHGQGQGHHLNQHTPRTSNQQQLQLPAQPSAHQPGTSSHRAPFAPPALVGNVPQPNSDNRQQHQHRQQPTTIDSNIPSGSSHSHHNRPPSPMLSIHSIQSTDAKSVGGGGEGGGSVNSLNSLASNRKSSTKMRAQLNAANARLGRPPSPAQRRPIPPPGGSVPRNVSAFNNGTADGSSVGVSALSLNSVGSMGSTERTSRAILGDLAGGGGGVPLNVSAFGTGVDGGGSVASLGGSTERTSNVRIVQGIKSVSSRGGRNPSPARTRSSGSVNQGSLNGVPQMRVVKGLRKERAGGGLGGSSSSSRSLSGSSLGGGMGEGSATAAAVGGRPPSPWRYRRMAEVEAAAPPPPDGGTTNVAVAAAGQILTTENVRPQDDDRGGSAGLSQQQRPQDYQGGREEDGAAGGGGLGTDFFPEQQQQQQQGGGMVRGMMCAREVRPQDGVPAQQLPSVQQIQQIQYASPPPSNHHRLPPRGPTPTHQQFQQQQQQHAQHSQQSVGSSRNDSQNSVGGGVAKTPPPPPPPPPTTTPSYLTDPPGRPSPSRTYSPVDLDETPPETPPGLPIGGGGGGSSPIVQGMGSLGMGARGSSEKDRVGGARGIHRAGSSGGFGVGTPNGPGGDMQQQQQQTNRPRPPAHPSPTASVHSTGGAPNHHQQQQQSQVNRTPSGLDTSQLSHSNSIRSVKSDASKKSLADLAVDSNCIAGRFQEVVVDLSESDESFDSADEEYLTNEERLERRRLIEEVEEEEKEKEEALRRMRGERGGVDGSRRPKTAEEVEEDRVRASVPEGMDYGPRNAGRRTTPPMHPGGGSGGRGGKGQGQPLHSSPMRQPFPQSGEQGGGGGGDHHHGSSRHRRSESLEQYDISYEEDDPRQLSLNRHLNRSIPIDISVQEQDQLSPSSLMTGITNVTGGNENVDEPTNLKDHRVEIDQSDPPPVNDRARAFDHPPLPPQYHPSDGGHHEEHGGDRHRDRHRHRRYDDGHRDQDGRNYRHDDGHEHQEREPSPPPPDPAVQFRSSWMLPNNHKKTAASASPNKAAKAAAASPANSGYGSDAGGRAYAGSGPHGAAAAGGVGSCHGMPTSGARSAPGVGYRNGGGGGDSQIMANVMDRMRSSMRVSIDDGNGESAMAGRARSFSPDGRRRANDDGDHPATLPKLRHRRDDGVGGKPGTGDAPCIVFGDPTSFGAAAGEDAAQEAPTIRDRAKAIEGWMGGKGIAINKEVKPTAGYDHDDMYQNAYLRRTSPQVTTRKAPSSGADGSDGTTDRVESGSDASGPSRIGSVTATKSPPPAFLASAVAAWSRGENSPPRPRDDDPPSVPREFAAPRARGGQNYSSSSSNNNNGPGQEVRPYRQTSPTKENAPPAFLSAVDGWKEDANMASNADQMDPKKSVQQQQHINPAVEAKEDDDMAYLASWSRSRGTPRKSPNAGGRTSAPNTSFLSDASSPDPFEAVENGSFSDEFGHDDDALGDDYHSPDRAEWQTATGTNRGGGGPSSSSEVRHVAKQTILFDDRAADHDDGWNATNGGDGDSRHFNAAKEQGQKQRQQSQPTTFDDPQEDPWQVHNSRPQPASAPPFGDGEWMNFHGGAGSAEGGADAGGFEETFDDPFFKSDFGEGGDTNAFREVESRLASPSSYPRQQTSEL